MPWPFIAKLRRKVSAPKSEVRVPDEVRRAVFTRIAAIAGASALLAASNAQAALLPVTANASTSVMTSALAQASQGSGAIPAAVLRTLAQAASDREHVTNFGVVGNGADESVLLQAAINATAGKASLLIPAGMTITVGTGNNAGAAAAIQIPSNAQIILEGDIVLRAGTYTNLSHLLQITGNNFRIEGGGTLDGNASNVTSAHPIDNIGSLQATAPTNGLIQGITSTNAKNSPFNILGGNSIVVAFCTFSNSANSVGFALGGKDCHFYHNIAKNIPDEGFGFYLGMQNGSIIGNRCQNCGSGPYVFNDSAASLPSSSILIADNVIVDCVTGINVNNVSNLQSFTDINIKNNQIKYTTTPTETSFGIQFDGVIGGTVIGNTISAASGVTVGTALVIGGSPMGDILVLGNKFCQVSGGSVVLVGGLTATSSGAIVIADNLFTNTGSPIIGVALNAVTASSPVFVIDNYFFGTWSAEVNDGTGGFAFLDNIIHNGTQRLSNVVLRATQGLILGTSGQVLTVNGGPGAAGSSTSSEGSLWLRTDGGAGTRAYLGHGGGNWSPIVTADGPIPFASLPASPYEGMTMVITDSPASPAFMAPAAGGGSTHCPVKFIGTQWVNA